MTKKQEPTTAAEQVAPEVPKTEVMSIQAQIAQQLARQAETAKGLRSSGSFITFKNANLKVDGISIPANELNVRVLATISERAWYAKELMQTPCRCLTATHWTMTCLTKRLLIPKQTPAQSASTISGAPQLGVKAKAAAKVLV